MSLIDYSTWTETYDVLKSKTVIHEAFKHTWTETYDVLKYRKSNIFRRFNQLEPKHMMYWNKPILKHEKLSNFLEPKHMMYWNFLSRYIASSASTWTETYDVLKLPFKALSNSAFA